MVILREGWDARRAHAARYGDAKRALFDVCQDGVIRRMFIEDNICADSPGVGLEISDADTMLAYLKNLEGH
jgi:hypothetical protein